MAGAQGSRSPERISARLSARTFGTNLWNQIGPIRSTPGNDAIGDVLCLTDAEAGTFSNALVWTIDLVDGLKDCTSFRVVPREVAKPVEVLREGIRPELE